MLVFESLYQANPVIVILKKKKKIVHLRHIYKSAVQYSEILNKEEDIEIQIIVTKQ